MEKLFQKIKIEKFKIIQKELLNLIPAEKLNLTGSNVESWILDINDALSKCPNLSAFLKSRAKKNVAEMKFYVSPVDIGTGYHTDGCLQRQPFALTLPVQNTNNTYLNWYKEDATNFKRRILKDEPLHNKFEWQIPDIFVPIDTKKLELIGSYEIIEPSFVRNDLMHRVVNNSSGVRIILTIRWPKFYTEINDIMDLSDIIDVF